MKEFGRMLSSSKSSYMVANPTHHVIFNANLCTKSAGKIWFGDLDLDLATDQADLLELRSLVGEDIFVLHEMDARFDNEHSPKFDQAVAIVFDDAITIINVTE